uniref:Uncharacterized protein n=1 Tax=viral metagenome TaxID=1070528 RepID=A0A6H1ZDA6_9ZZZZ
MRCEKCSDSQKEIYGCEKDSTYPDKWQVRDLTWQRCPVKLVTIETHLFLEAYSYLQKGILPYNTGYKRNSNKYIEAMRIIETEVKRIEAENIKRAKK